MGAAVGALVFVAARASGAYFPSTWPLVAGAVLLPVFALSLLGFRPSRRVTLAAAGLAAYGLWSLVSVAWGGLPDVAWTTLDQSLLGAGALVLGSSLAGGVRPPFVAGGVLAGVTAEAVELLYRLQAGGVPADWFDGRKVQGPVGYANAQAALLALGIPIAVWLAGSSKPALRVLSGAAAGTLVGALLLTQSRGGLLALAAALVVQVAASPSIRRGALALAVAIEGALLWNPLRTVDRALVDGSPAARVSAFRHDVHWVLVGVLALAVLAAAVPRLTLPRRAALATVAAVVVAAPAVVFLTHRHVVHDLRAALSSPRSSAEPAYLPGGDTRLSSLSFTGRLKTWRVAWRLYEANPALGAGKGEFSRAWDQQRPNHNLSVLQPHSLELEALSELGPVGLGALVVFAAGAVFALARRGRGSAPLAAAGAAVLVLLLGQASVDWTFSFPALVVAALLVVGAAAGGASRRPAGAVTQAWLTLGALVAAVAFGAQYLSARTLHRADRALAHDPARAWDLAARARRYNRWSPDVVVLQARIAAATGHPLLSAALYARAAELAQRPWLDEMDRAVVLARAGRTAESRAACRAARAANPLEVALRSGVCGDVS